MIRRLWMSLPKLVRFMLVHIANGMVIGCAVPVRADLARRRRAEAACWPRTRAGSRPSCSFFQTALTFGAVSMGIAVMHLGED